MFNRRREFLKLRLAATDAAVTAVAFGLAYLLRQHLTGFRLFYLERGPLVGLLISVLAIWLAAGWAIGLYRIPDVFDVRRTARDILRQTIWSAAALLGVLYLVKLSDISRGFMLLFIAINMLLLLAWRLSAPRLSRSTASEAAKRYYVIVGTGEDAERVARLIEGDGSNSAQVLAFIRDGAPGGNETDAAIQRTVRTGDGCPVLEMGALTRMLNDRVVDEVIFAVDRQRVPQLEELFLTCEEEGVKVRVVVNFFPGMASDVSLDKLHDVPLLTFSTTPDNDYLLLVKRVFDVAVAMGLSILFAPISLLVMLAIRLSSKGPIFFAQERCGLNGRRFRIYKFRSMHQDAEAQRTKIAGLNEMDGPVFKCANDPRVTAVGRFLRKFSIDEWPQLLNVIKGDMSLVGPRPPLPEEVQQYKRWQRRRLRMRPGLTCLWVLEGRNKLDFFSWMRLDLHYIDEWSLALDCKILLQSIPHVLSGKGM
jgi:exopolysaccharide biosynthesis polyprenyl glycosylphosphotransferase